MRMVSIIIPVYNAENYIRECLDSLLRQTYPHFEVICVDDGSGDSSYEIIKEYAEHDPRISVMTQKNQYAGAARNAGMKRAGGKYLLFLDADDFFCDDMLEQLVEEAEREQTDVLVFDAYQFDHALQKVSSVSGHFLRKDFFGEGIKSAWEMADAVYDFTMPAAWNKLFLREFIFRNNLEFQRIQRANDLFFTYAALSCAERIGVVNKKLMYYRDHNPQSLQGSMDDTPDAFAQAVYALHDFLKSRSSWEKFRESFYNMAVRVCITNLGNMKSEEAYRCLYKKLRDEIVPSLQIEMSPPDIRLSRAIQEKEDLIIYGAGMLASVFVRMLIFQYGYEAGRLAIAVTSPSGNASELYGVRVCGIEEISGIKKNNLVVIAVSEETIQKKIEGNLRDRHFERILKLGFREMFSLIGSTSYREI